MSDVASLLADVDRQLHAVVATFGEPVAGVLGPIAGSGSRHRARLVLELAGTGDGTLAVRGAAAVELLHLGTLVHDDIVDGSPLRRHSPTVHTALGLPVALWTADALYAEALHLADAVTPAGGLALGDALRRIADSQILEALGATTARYWDVVDGKTVSLFEASFALADEAAGGALPGAVRDAVRAYGRLFQYVDDLQDIGGEADALGKPTGLDADNELHTLPAADLVVSADAVRDRLRELSGPIVRFASGTDSAELLNRMTDHLLDAAGRVLDPRARVSADIRLPAHIAVIMDGNGRWAERQGLARTDGHSRGEERLAEIVRASDALGVKWLTAYGFSTENWRRPRLEVDFILGLHKKIFGRRQEMHENNVKIRWIGRDPRAGSRIPMVVRREIEKSTRLTEHNTGLNFTVAFDYGGRQELVEAARAIATTQPDRVDAASVQRHLYAADLPPVDLMVRTSGEGRISNFLLWEGVGAHLYVTPTLWPDFGAAELDAAIDWWRDRTS